MTKAVAIKVQSKTGALQKYFDVDNPNWKPKEFKTLEGVKRSQIIYHLYMNKNHASKSQTEEKNVFLNALENRNIGTGF